MHAAQRAFKRPTPSSVQPASSQGHTYHHKGKRQHKHVKPGTPACTCRQHTTNATLCCFSVGLLRRPKPERSQTAAAAQSTTQRNAPLSKPSLSESELAGSPAATVTREWVSGGQGSYVCDVERKGQAKSNETPTLLHTWLWHQPSQET